MKTIKKKKLDNVKCLLFDEGPDQNTFGQKKCTRNKRERSR